MSAKRVHLGFEIGTGTPVEIPVRHMVVTGQTQEAGKTTTLEALITRAGLRAITFVTKRGEGAFRDARRIEPYFREQADWKFVASILEASRGEKLKFERAWIIRASKGARTLADVRANVQKALNDPKTRGMSQDVYLTLDAYLEDVVPQIDRINWAKRIVLGAGVNAMDLTGISAEMQHLVIRSALDWVLEREENTVVVIPEAWKFMPEGRGTPVKLAAESFIRQGAGLGNYMWIDSQDIAGVDKKTLKQVPVWVLGVQREANEIKRTLDNIPASVKKPKAADVATLGLGEFFACWGTHAVKTYVQPAWMNDAQAQQVATGRLTTRLAAKLSPRAEPIEDSVTEAEARELRQKNADLEQTIENLRRQIEALSSNAKGPESAPVSGRRQSGGDAGSTPAMAGAHTYSADESLDNEQLYQAFKKRLIEELPKDATVLRIITQKQELRVEVEKQIVDAKADTLLGKVALLISEGFFDNGASGHATFTELKRRGQSVAKPSVYREADKLAARGFLTKEDGGYRAVAGMKVNIVER